MGIIDFITPFIQTTEVSLPEAVMLICFGMSWPISIFKAVKTKMVLGKSPLFMLMIVFGYICGISHKIFYSPDLLIILYIINLAMILTDLYIYTRYNISETAAAINLTPFGKPMICANRGIPRQCAFSDREQVSRRAVRQKIKHVEDISNCLGRRPESIDACTSDHLHFEEV